MVHTLGRQALVASRQTSDESFLREALTHFSQFNEKHQKTCPAWKLHNNKSQPRRKYCIQPQCTNPIEFGWALLSLLDCQSCVFLPSCCYHFDLQLQIQISSSSTPTSENDFKLWENYQTEAKALPWGLISQFMLLCSASKWSLDGWAKIFCSHRF